MNLENWALIAEIISGFAIVVTLIVLVYETRQSTAATYAASYDQLSADMASWRMALANNPEMQENYFRFLFDETGSQRPPVYEDIPYETGRIVASNLFLLYERAYFAREYGRLGTEEWIRYSNAMCGPLARRLWPRLDAGWYTNEFVRFIHQCQAE